MKNLAGDKNADRQVREELYLAGIPMEEEISRGEVPYKTIGKLGSWTFRRAWYYWMVWTENTENGLPLETAMKLHYKKNPVDDQQIMGTSIRSGGHCGCPPPDEYGSDPLFDEELNNQLMALGYKKEYNKILKKDFVDISNKEIRRLCDEGRLKVKRYVCSYHVDDQVGLNMLAKAIKKLEAKKLR